jgi:hypothetical protein
MGTSIQATVIVFTGPKAIGNPAPPQGGCRMGKPCRRKKAKGSLDIFLFNS